jgi:hypothetical protein
MRFRRGSKSSSKAKKGAAAAPWQNGERKVDGGGPGSNSRQVAPDDDTGIVGNVDDGNAVSRSVPVLVWIKERLLVVLAYRRDIFGLQCLFFCYGVAIVFGRYFFATYVTCRSVRLLLRTDRRGNAKITPISEVLWG